MLKAVATGAASTFGGDLVGWVLGSGGAANQDVEVLNKILNELDTIEQTLQGIADDLAQLENEIQVLDCDQWVQNALPMVAAISNLWNLVEAEEGSISPEQYYVGIVQETKANTVTIENMQSWVDRVLNNDNKGINGLSLQDYLQDLAHVLIPPSGGSGLIQSCLSVASNKPSSFPSDITDGEYYNKTALALVGYYYTIQVQGVTMVVEAMNFEAWMASGQPISNTANIQDLPEQTCGTPANPTVQQWCENAQWAVYGVDGSTGVRGRIAQQLTFAGAPYTQSWNVSNVDGSGLEPTHRFIDSTELWASSPPQFQATNSPECTQMNSNNPCGILSGTFSNTTIGGTYALYGEGHESGTWLAASGPQMQYLMVHGTKFNDSYVDVRDWLLRVRGYVDLPEDVIFLTSQNAEVKPYGQGVSTNAITFTDTGLSPLYFPQIFSSQVDWGNYINTAHSLQLRYCNGQCGGCTSGYTELFDQHPQLPAPSKNRNFYVGSSCFAPCNGGPCGQWMSGPPGWTTDVGAANKHPQFRLPVIDIDTLPCSEGIPATNPSGARRMCGEDFYAWLYRQVPQPLADAEPPLSSEKEYPPSDLNPGAPELPYDRREIWTGEGRKKKFVEATLDEENCAQQEAEDLEGMKAGKKGGKKGGKKEGKKGTVRGSKGGVTKCLSAIEIQTTLTESTIREYTPPMVVSDGFGLLDGGSSESFFMDIHVGD